MSPHSLREDDYVIRWKHFPRYWPFEPVPGDFPAQRLVTRSFDVFFDLRLNKRLSKQSWGWWSPPLWRHCNEISGIHIPYLNYRSVSVTSYQCLLMEFWSVCQKATRSSPLQWRHGVTCASMRLISHGFLFNRYLRPTTSKTTIIHIAGPLWGDQLVNAGSHSEKATYTKNVPMSCRHWHVISSSPNVSPVEFLILTIKFQRTWLIWMRLSNSNQKKFREFPVIYILVFHKVGISRKRCNGM